MDIQLTPYVNVVKYKEEFFVHFSNTANGNAKLLNSNGVIFSGTPSPAKLTPVKKIECVKYNGHLYFKTKIGVFSCSTGKKVVDVNILNKFGV